MQNHSHSQASHQAMHKKTHPHEIGRRGLLAAAGLAALTSASTTNAQDPATAETPVPNQVNASAGKLKQGVCKWCYSKMTLKELAAESAKLGLVGIDLLGPKDFPTLKKHGLVCTMVRSHSLANGLCDPKFHKECLEKMNQAIEAAAKEGYRNVICFSGNARGIRRKEGMKNCVKVLKEITPIAEKANVILNMELLNSRVNHPDYMCDKSSWGIELCKQVESDNFKLLYDIYHMQIMEGDIIRTIEDNGQYFGHYHTGGNPGRHELDENQELFYPAIAKAIAETGFEGYFSHEFIPAGDPISGLTDAVRQCTV